MKRKMKVLLVEPSYRNKYPPLGLMKIATAHRLLGDEVRFVKGTNVNLRNQHWDQIYITTLFTFHWNTSIKTIRFYARGKSPVMVGGILASLMPNEIEEATGIKPHVGPFRGNVKELLQAARQDEYLTEMLPEIQERGIDALPPDYGIFDGQDVPYRKILDLCYVLRTTKGCHRKCKFCAVQDLEPCIVPRIALGTTISYIERKWGPRQNLLLLDDNVLASPNFGQIIDEIHSLGFEKGAKFNRRRRYVDFNQGLDARLLSRKQLKALATIELRPLRLAFDNISLKDLYERKISWAIQAGFSEIASYVLYNYNDKPSDLYKRLEIGCKINERNGCRVYSFPMKYIPCGDKDRSYLGPHWTRRQIRGVQCILNATHGIAPAKSAFFRAAFGRNVTEFCKIIQMPEDCIIGRGNSELANNIRDWQERYSSLNASEKRQFRQLISKGKGKVTFFSSNPKIQDTLALYSEENNHKGTLSG